MPANPAFGLRHDTMETGIRKHHRQQADAGVRYRKIAWETVNSTDRREGVVADPTAGRGILLRCGGAHYNLWQRIRQHRATLLPIGVLSEFARRQ